MNREWGTGTGGVEPARAVSPFGETDTSKKLVYVPFPALLMLCHLVGHHSPASFSPNTSCPSGAALCATPFFRLSYGIIGSYPAIAWGTTHPNTGKLPKKFHALGRRSRPLHQTLRFAELLKGGGRGPVRHYKSPSCILSLAVETASLSMEPTEQSHSTTTTTTASPTLAQALFDELTANVRGEVYRRGDGQYVTAASLGLLTLVPHFLCPPLVTKSTHACSTETF